MALVTTIILALSSAAQPASAAPATTMGAPMAAMGAPMTAMGPATPTPSSTAAGSSPDSTYTPIEIEVLGLVWYGPGQNGLIEAHPLVMGLAVMALATVTLLFFFLRGAKRRRDEEL